ncbi:hypothetical protein HP459_15340 [Enterobacter sp. CM29]|uniref:hypothetical protein n=1 Tax=Enterobacter sp. CM29 TaxID=2738449 RepID=UPI0015C5658B|nr:hypothetical protein [Enterobacter sp. CM29]NQD62755.1 hypothetical protein [Enterobacter sp. CM29]
MRPWKKRSFKKTLFDNIAIFSMAPFLCLFSTISETKFTWFMLFFAIGFYATFSFCENLTRKGHNKIAKELFNALWNFETAFVFCYALYSFLYKSKGELSISNILTSAFTPYPRLFMAGIIILIATVIFRFALSIADLLVDSDKVNNV